MYCWLSRLLIAEGNDETSAMGKSLLLLVRGGLEEEGLVSCCFLTIADFERLNRYISTREREREKDRNKNKAENKH